MGNGLRRIIIISVVFIATIVFWVSPSTEWRSAIVCAVVLEVIVEIADYLAGKSQRIAILLQKNAVKFAGQLGGRVIVMLLGGMIGFFIARALHPPPRSILYISPVRFISSQPFYGEFLDRLIQESANKNIDVTVWEPDEDWIANSQQRLLKEAAKRKREYAALVFTPFIESSKNSGPEEEELFRFLSETKDLNVVLFDTDLPESLRDRLIKENLAIPPCVK